MDNRFNVVEVLWGPPATIGRVRVVPVRKAGFKNQLRNARYLLCNVDFNFADGFACGIISQRRSST